MKNQELFPLIERLDRIEQAIKALVGQNPVKEWHSTGEAAEILGRAEYTVREWCRCGRIRAKKRHYPRGAYPQWMISRDELERIQNEGLLPPNPNQRPAQ